MPAGVSWSQYIRFSAAAFATMMAGAQTVHYYYRPLEDMDKYIDREVRHHQDTSEIILPGPSI